MEKESKLKSKLGSSTQLPSAEKLKGNIENFIGWTSVPTGLTSNLRINGQYAKGTFNVPLATTEGALVASYSRGAKAITEAGGATCIITRELLQRCPLFRFEDALQAHQFSNWVKGQLVMFQYTTRLKSRFAQLVTIDTLQEGNNTSVILEFTTGEAAGQNMITICSQAICDVILTDSPVQPIHYYIEGNLSGDKKATAKALHHVRGKRVTAEVLLPKIVIKKILKSTAYNMSSYWTASTLSSIQSGTIGAQGHFANGLTALYLSTGQDVACVAESAIGITLMESVGKDLYASVTLPSLILGTVGGGTWLPSQVACLEHLDCTGPDSSKKLAEIVAGLVLAGELSIAAALAEGHFTQAHISLGRKNK